LPDLGPIYADLSGIAPLYVMAGEHEILRGEVERLAEATRALEALGVAIRQRMSKHIQGTA